MIGSEPTKYRSRIRKAPAAIGLEPKTLSTDEENLAIREACRAHTYCDLPLPVLFRRRQIGWVLGFQHTPDVMFMPYRRSLDKMVAAGFPTYDSLISAITQSGQFYIAVWSKGLTTAMVANNFYDLFPTGGNPAPGTYVGSASSSLQFTDASTGALNTQGNVSPATKCITQLFAVGTAGAPPQTLIPYDRCVTYENVPFNDAVTNTFTQSNSPVSLRYNSGAPGMKIIVTCQTVESTVAQSFTALVYVDQDGNTGVNAPCSTTSTNIIVSAATPTSTLGARVVSPSATAASTFTTGAYFPLATGDTGVRQITSMTMSAVTANTGKLCFVLGVPLGLLPLATAGVTSLVDTVMMTAALTQIFDGACISFLAYTPVTTATTISGGINVAWA